MCRQVMLPSMSVTLAEVHCLCLSVTFVLSGLAKRNFDNVVVPCSFIKETVTIYVTLEFTIYSNLDTIFNLCVKVSLIFTENFSMY